MMKKANTEKARISEIFLSLQGEGPYFGVPQLFLRFYDCNLSCAFCDTNLTSYRTLTVEKLMARVAKFKKPYHSIALTGGEPLLQADFIRSFLPGYRKSYKRPVYLETNGTLYGGLKKVIDHVDIIAMDFKLFSSTKRKSLWEEHEKFLRIARRKKVFVKTVITPATSSAEIICLRDVVEKINKNIPIILQPVTPLNNGERVGFENLRHFKDLLEGPMRRVEIIPQVHKLINVK
jgi:organic radical activating enzyme